LRDQIRCPEFNSFYPKSIQCKNENGGIEPSSFRNAERKRV